MQDDVKRQPWQLEKNAYVLMYYRDLLIGDNNSFAKTYCTHYFLDNGKEK